MATRSTGSVKLLLQATVCWLSRRFSELVTPHSNATSRCHAQVVLLYRSFELGLRRRSGTFHCPSLASQACEAKWCMVGMCSTFTFLPNLEYPSITIDTSSCWTRSMANRIVRCCHSIRLASRAPTRRLQRWIFLQTTTPTPIPACSTTKIHVSPSNLISVCCERILIMWCLFTVTWYLLTSADHNTIQINKIGSDGSIGAQASTLSMSLEVYVAPSGM
jgi:hypothetical protein